MLRQRVFRLIIAELREHGRASIDSNPITAMEVEAVWGLHAAIFSLGVRKFIYNMAVADIDKVVEMELQIFINGVSSVLAK